MTKLPIDILLESLENNSGNYHSDSIVYISNENIIKIEKLTKEKRLVLNLLVTPFLINVHDGRKYELIDYEISNEVIGQGTSKVIEYHKNNLLPKEVNEWLKPKLIVHKDDYHSFINFYLHYFEAMQRMTFEEDKTAQKLFNSGFKLFYQIL